MTANEAQQAEIIQSFLSILPGLSEQELDLVGQVLYSAKQTIPAKEFKAPFEIPKLNVPAEFQVNYHQFFFQALLTEIFRPSLDEDFYAPSDPTELTNDSSVIITSSWDDTQIKTGQVPHIVVDSEYCALSPMYLADRSDKGVTRVGNKSIEHSACKMEIGMLIQVVAGRAQEANNLGNLVLVNLAKMRKFAREFFGLYTISFPQMSPAAQMEGSPTNKYISSIRFKTEKFVNWSETITEQTFKHIIYRLVGVMCETDNKPLVQLILGSSAVSSLDPTLRSYIERILTEKK